MNTHESIRSMLSLAAAGALGPQEQSQVEAHARVCEACSRELDGWAVYTIGLQGLPQPSIPADLIARTQARVLREREAAAAARWNGMTLCGLGIFSWVASISFWLVVRELTDGMVIVLGTNLVSAGPWFLVSFGVAAITAVATAVLVGNRDSMGRVL